MSGTELFSSVVGVGADVLITNGGAVLPTRLNCSIRNPADATVVYQTIGMDTSGTVDFFLKDTFGSLEVEACANDQGLSSDCIVDVTYTYTMTNVGTSDMTITVVSRTRNSQTVDLLNLVPVPFLMPGESTIVRETEALDICVDGSYTTTVEAAADPPTGFPCLGSDTYVFDVPVSCRVDVTIGCVDEMGRECQQITPANGICSDGDAITVASFTYRGASCAQSANNQAGFVCEDSAAGPPPTTGTAVIACMDGAGGVPIVTTTLMVGSVLNLLNGGMTLPATTVCTVSNTVGVVLQTITFNPSGSVDFVLNDVYGSLELDSCTDSAGTTLDCLLDVTYTYELRNVGTNDMDVTRVERNLNGQIQDLIGLVPVTDRTLSPGQSTTVQETIMIDACVDGFYRVSVEVEADPPAGVPCLADDVYVFDVGVSCRVDVQIDCTSTNGVECTQLESPPGQCSDGDEITVVRFRYLGGGCSQSRNTQGPSTTCSDFGTGPPTDNQVRITCSDGSVVLADSLVLPNGPFVVTGANGGTLPTAMSCMISTADGSSGQDLEINASGSVDFYLKDIFGSLEVESCTDNVGETNDCIEEITYTYTLENIGTNSMNVTLVERTSNGVTTDLLSLVPDTDLAVGESTMFTENQVIDLCLDATYETSVRVEADPPAGAPCFDTDAYVFETTVSCRVDVEVSCVGANGVECQSLEEPDGQCSDGDMLTILQMRYIGGGCGQSSNTQNSIFTCEDFSGGPAATGDCVISCTGPGGVNLFMGTVSVGNDIFLMTMAPPELPESATCEMTSTGGDLLQRFTFDPSGGTELTLKDVFGSLELESCTDVVGETETCFMDVTYTYDLINVGTNNMDVTLVQRTRNGATVNLLPQVPDTDLAPGEQTGVVETETIDLCVPNTFETVVRAEADPPAGVPCFDEDVYVFTIDVGCRVDVQIDCTSTNGVECTQLESPPGQCSDGDEITVVRFRYLGGGCSQSRNTQGPSTTCSDFGTGPPTDNQVRITCSDGSVVLADSLVLPNGPFVVTGANGGTLPTAMSCMISTADGSSGQDLEINASGSVDFYLKDIFGSLEVESCTDNVGETNDCIEEITYTYTLENIGTNSMNVTLVERTSNGVTTDLLSLVPDTDLAVGESTMFTENQVIDLCLDATYETSVRVEADPPAGAPCFDTDAYVFETTVSCRVDVEVSCVGANGVECQSLEEPDGQCSDGDMLTILQMRYIGGGCGQSSNTQNSIFTCEDFSGGPAATGDCVISCTGPGGVNLFMGTVSVGNDIFLMTMAPPELPESATCEMTSTGGDLLQRFTFDPSGGTELTLKDVFGSLELESCTDVVGETETCFMDVTYTYDLINVGTNNMDVTLVQRTRNGATVNLLPQVPDTDLAPGEQTGVVETETIDLCVPNTFETVVRAEANPPAGVPCFDEDVYAFTIEVVCDVDVFIDCTVQDGPLAGTDCATSLGGEQLPQCSGSPPTELCFRYTAQRCDAQGVGQGGLISCGDLGMGPQFMADLVISNGPNVFVDDMIMIGSEICVSNNGNPLPSEIVVFVGNQIGGADPSPAQQLVIDTTCSGIGLRLLDSFGSLDLVSYTNSDGFRDCFVNVQYDYVVTNVGQIKLTITEFQRTFNNQTTNLIGSATPAELMLMPTETFSDAETIEISLCEDIQYMASTSVVAEGEDGKPCDDRDAYNFNVVVGTPFPTTSPSSAPSPAPSASPSMSPTSPPSPSPSAAPSPSPSEPPSPPPSASPSDPPTPSPSAPPTIARSEIPSPSPSAAPSDPPTPSPSAAPSDPPTPSPSAAPSPSPSAPPTIARSAIPSPSPSEPPSPSPSASPSDPPTPSPSASPSEPPSPSPSAPPSAPPTIARSEIPSPSPSAPPTIARSEIPSPSPSEPPSPSPSEPPSPSPSDPPSPSPSNPPSPSPSAAPSPSPSSPPSVMPVSPSPSSAPSAPTVQCMVEVDVACIPSDGSADCDSILPLITICEDRPFAMVMRYNGGSCAQSFNSQIGTDLFRCIDFQGGPPTTEGTESFIVATDIKGDGIIYFAGSVPVGGSFTLSDGGNNVEANMNITIYSSSDTSPGNILQTLIYHSSCSRNLFLKDRFGSVQLVLFVSEDQGLISCFFNATFSFDIVAMGNFSAELVSLISITNLGVFNLTDRVIGQQLQPGESINVQETVVIDLTIRQQYTALTTITGRSPDGTLCRGTDTLSFVAGNPLPPVIPTLAPTVSPTGTPLPTPDPLTTACALNANINCRVTEGQNTNCRGLDAPQSMTCLGDANPTSLSFIYSGGSCDESMNDGNFRCEDTGDGPNRRQNVHIEISRRDTIYFSGEVTLGEFFVASGAYENDADVVISEVDGAGNVGEALQESRLRTRCREDDDLTLLNTFGALQLVGFTNGPTGSQNVFATVRVEYVIENRGRLNGDVTSAVSTGAFAGTRDLVNGQTVTLANREEEVVGFEEMRLNLLDVTMVTQSFSFTVQGVGSAGGPACSNTETFDFIVA